MTANYWQNEPIHHPSSSTYILYITPKQSIQVLFMYDFVMPQLPTGLNPSHHNPPKKQVIKASDLVTCAACRKGLDP